MKISRLICNKSFRSAFFGFTVFAALYQAHADTLTYKVVDGVRAYCSTSGWYKGTAACGRIPGASDYVHLTGTDLDWSNPLVISTNAFVKPTAFIIARNAGDVAAVRLEAGAGAFGICKGGGDNSNYGYFIGRYGRGLFINNGGNANFYARYGLYVGGAAGGEGVISNLSGRAYLHTMYAGVAGATGTVVVADGTVGWYDWSETNLRFGHGGCGRLELKGGLLDASTATVASNSGGQGNIRLGTASGGTGTFHPVI